MGQKTVVIALLDKLWPPQHSFVDGMLAKEAATQQDTQVRLLVSYSEEGDIEPRRYKSSVCIPILYPRRGSGRFRNLSRLAKLLYYQARREQSRGKGIVLFVRNDPVYLLAASLLHRYVDRIVFQSSFPHEKYSGHFLKRSVALLLYRIAGRRVDVVTAVSPEGVARVHRLCPNARAGGHIPLLADLPRVNKESPFETNREHLTFVYIGAHSPRRSIETILIGIADAVSQGVSARFRFVGASEDDERRLLKDTDAQALTARGIVSFERPIPRAEVPYILASCDIGLSLIPNLPIYFEASPTKLAEYMGAGLAVLATRGIPMQEQFVNDSAAGLLVDWSSRDIADGIVKMCQEQDRVPIYKENARLFASSSLQYRAYLPQFRHLLGLSKVIPRCTFLALQKNRHDTLK